jgi:rhodanese-related sulfurtransferase
VGIAHAQDLAIVKIIDSTQLQERLNGNIHLVDVRTDGEFAQGHIKGAIQINISSDDFMEKMDQLDKSKPIVLYCAVGGRSTAAVGMIRKLGFPVIYNFRGGIREWNKEKLPLEKP